MASGLIPSLRALHPNARISWLCEAPAAPLLQHNPHLDEVIIWPRGQWKLLWKTRRWLTLFREVCAFKSLLRNRRYDLVLDAQGLLKSGLCTWLSRAPRRIGLRSREGSQFLVNEHLDPPAGADVRMGSEYRYLARHLGARDEWFQPDVAIGEAARHKAREVLNAAGAKGRVAVLCPFTTRPQKHWFEDYWLELAHRLASLGLTPVVLGGPTDREAGVRLAQRCSALINLAGDLKLDESVAVVAESTVLVGVDTGLTHLGSALHIPTVALFGSTRPYLDAGVPTTNILYDALPCSPCRRHPTCAGAFTCMRQLTVERVLAKAREVLEHRS